MPDLTGLASLLLGAVAVSASGVDAPGRHFSIRADLSVAKPIDELLGRIAEPVELRLPAGTDAAAVLQKICGSRAPANFELLTRDEDGQTAQFVRYKPCLRETNLTARVTPGDTLEAIAVRLGMRASSVDALRVRDREGVVKAGSKIALAPGDRVVAKKAPDWTGFTTLSDEVPDRAALIGLIAKAIGCGSESADACLIRRSILVVEDKPTHKHEAPPPAPAPAAAPDRGAFSSIRAAIVPAAYHPTPIRLLAAAAVQPPPAPPPPPVTPDTAPVDPRQWPYDADLVAKILAEDVNGSTAEPNVFIGVAENGLGDKFGRPLAIAAFPSRTRDDPTNGRDDDDNDYVDDWIGAGVRRNQDEIMASGDVSLCPTSGQVYSSWQGTRLKNMSHGSVVASIASGGSLPANGALAPALPRVVFFRMAKKVCSDADDDGSGEREAISAIDYLVLRDIRVLNLSFFFEGAAGETVRDRLIALMQYEPPLLVLPAGNYIAANLDVTKDCPACLGNPTEHSDIARLTLVVGAATSNRKIADYSGYGVQTVKLYAPGEATGSLLLAGQSGDTLQPATSYSVPRVSFAAGLIQALGLRDIPKVRSRLLLSTWPLHPDSQPLSDGSGGILDLVKAAAVRHDAVEVVQPDASGALVRHTYVGKIVGGLGGICSGYGISEAAVQAIRFGEPAADGFREARITQRLVNPTTREPRVRIERCQSSGTLQLDAIRDGRQDLDLGSVRLILFKGIYP